MSPETELARAILKSRGYEPNITDLVDLSIIPDYAKDDSTRAVLCISYQGERKGKNYRYLVAEINAPTVSCIFKLLENSKRAGAFFQRALNAIPENKRPAPLPSEIEHAEPNRNQLKDIKRAAELANRSARSGINSVSIMYKPGTKGEDTPF